MIITVPNDVPATQAQLIELAEGAKDWLAGGCDVLVFRGAGVQLVESERIDLVDEVYILARAVVPPKDGDEQ